VTFLVAANVINANVIRVLFVSISADALIAARSVAADCFWRVRAEKRVLEALVNVFAFFEAVAFESGFTRALDGGLIFWHAICVFNTRAVSKLWAKILDTADSISEEAVLTFAGEITVCVDALRVRRAVVLSRRAFVNVNALESIAVVAAWALAGISASKVFTSSDCGAIVLECVALVDIDAGASVAIEARFALALEASHAVDAERAFAAVVGSERALVGVLAEDAVAFVAVFAGALVRADGVLACSKRAAAVVFRLETLVAIGAAVSIAPEAFFANTLVRCRRCGLAIGVGVARSVVASSRGLTVEAVADHFWRTVAVVSSRRVHARRVSVTFVSPEPAFVEILAVVAVASEASIADA